MSKGNPPTTDPKFLGTLERWFRSQAEMLIMIRRSHAAGLKDFEFFTSFQTLSDRIRELQPLTSVIAFKGSQLPLRGVVDDSFIARCLREIPDGFEFLLVETVAQIDDPEWFRSEWGDSHADLRDALESSRGMPVAIGPYPPWLEDSDVVVSAVVPDERGHTNSGVY